MTLSFSSSAIDFIFFLVIATASLLAGEAGGDPEISFNWIATSATLRATGWQ